MEQLDFLNLIEDLNMDYLNLANDKAYFWGRRLIHRNNYGFINLYKKVKQKILLNGIKENKSHENFSIDERRKINEFNSDNYKVVIYSCITGNYDKSIIPKYKGHNIEYIMYSNNDCVGWNNRRIPDKIMKLNDSIAINRYIKFNPHELFENEFDYSIYVDGNINIISDLSKMIGLINNEYGFAFHKHYSRNLISDEAKYCIAYKKGNKKQILNLIKKYEREKFPMNYGLVEGNIIINDLNNLKAKNIMKSIWDEFYKLKTYRDQLIIPYVLWKNNIKIENISTLGNNVYKNPKIRVERHDK